MQKANRRGPYKRRPQNFIGLTFIERLVLLEQFRSSKVLKMASGKKLRTRGISKVELLDIWFDRLEPYQEFKRSDIPKEFASQTLITRWIRDKLESGLIDRSFRNAYSYYKTDEAQDQTHYRKHSRSQRVVYKDKIGSISDMFYEWQKVRQLSKPNYFHKFIRWVSDLPEGTKFQPINIPEIECSYGYLLEMLNTLVVLGALKKLKRNYCKTGGVFRRELISASELDMYEAKRRNYGYIFIKCA